MCSNPSKSPERLRKASRLNAYICRRFATSRNLQQNITLPLHGGGQGFESLGSTLREAYLSGNQVLVKALNPLAGGFVQQRQPSGIVWRFRWHARRFVGGGLFGGLFRGGIRRTATDGQEDRQSEGPNHDRCDPPNAYGYHPFSLAFVRCSQSTVGEIEVSL